MFSLFGIGANKDTIMESKILAGHFSGEVKVMVPRKGTAEPLVHHADKIVELLEKDIVKQEKDFTTKAVVHLWIALAALNKTSMLPCEENVFTHAIMKSRRYEGAFDIKAFDRMLVTKSATSDVEFEGTLMHNISDSQSGINIYLSIQYSALFVADNVNSVEGKGYGSIDISTSDVFKNFHKHF